MFLSGPVGHNFHRILLYLEFATRVSNIMMRPTDVDVLPHFCSKGISSCATMQLCFVKLNPVFPMSLPSILNPKPPKKLLQLCTLQPNHVTTNQLRALYGLTLTQSFHEPKLANIFTAEKRSTGGAENSSDVIQIVLWRW